MTKKVGTVKQTVINIDDFTFNYVDLNKDEKDKFLHTHTTTDLRINPFFPIKKAPTESEYPALFEKLKKDKYFTIQIFNLDGKFAESISFDYPKIKLQTLNKNVEKSTDGKRYTEEYAILNMIDKEIIDAIMIYGSKNPKSKKLIANDMSISCALSEINAILGKASGGRNDIQIKNTLEKLMKITIKREFADGREKLYKIVGDIEYKSNEMIIHFSLEYFKFFMSSPTINLSLVFQKMKSLENYPEIKKKKVNMALVQSIIEFMISHEPQGYQYHLSKILYYIKYIEERIQPNEIEKVKNIKNIKSNLKSLIPFFREFGISYCSQKLIFRYNEPMLISNTIEGL